LPPLRWARKVRPSLFRGASHPLLAYDIAKNEENLWEGMLNKVRKTGRVWVARIARFLGNLGYRKLISIDNLPYCEVSIHMLSGASKIDESMVSYRSFCIHTGRRYPLFLHDDGTFQDTDLPKLRKLIPEVTFLSKKKSDAEISALLKEYPESQKFRKESLWFVKLFDFFRYAPRERFIILDNDIICYSRLNEIEDWIENSKQEMLFQSERGISCAFSEKDLADFPFPLTHKYLNAGFGFVHKKAIDLVFCEEFLKYCRSNIKKARKVHLMEQMTWAFLTEKSGIPTRLLPFSYEISNDIFKSKGSKMRHYTGFTKHDIMYIEALMALPSLFVRSLLKAA